MTETNIPSDPGSRRAHWDAAYRSKTPFEVSWYQAEPTVSLRMIAACGLSPTARLVDVGGGASVLVERLLDLGFADVGVLDVSPAGLEHAKRRLSDKASRVDWVEADVTRWRPHEAYDLWHDRAVFHFLVEKSDRLAYGETLRRALRPGGYAVISTFAPDGPERCSGLSVMRHGPESLAAELGDGFRLVESALEAHLTPAGKVQNFCCCRFRRE